MPHLGREDLKETAREMKNEEEDFLGTRFVSRALPTVGIAYLTIYFGLDCVKKEDIPWLGLLKACFGTVSTEHYSYRDLYDEILEQTGSFSLALDAFSNVKDGSWKPVAAFTTKALYEKMPATAALAEEVFLRSDFSDKKRIREIMNELLSTMRMNLTEAGHSTAILRASAASDGKALFGELTGGVAFYRFIAELAAGFEKRSDEISRKLQEVSRAVFTNGHITVNLTAEEGRKEAVQEALRPLIAALPASGPDAFTAPDACRGNEGLKISGAVNYVALAGSCAEAGPYTGTLRVLRTLLRSFYLWQQIRVLGGAYGAMCNFPMTGMSYLCSYRDPNIRKTLEAYRAIPEFLENLTLTDQQMLGFVISSVGDLDYPLTPGMLGENDFKCLVSGITQEMVQKERGEVLNCSLEDIRASASYIRAMLKNAKLCVVGSAARIDEEKDLFDETETMFR